MSVPTPSTTMLLLALSHAEESRQKRFVSGLLIIPTVRWGKNY